MRIVEYMLAQTSMITSFHSATASSTQYEHKFSRCYSFFQSDLHQVASVTHRESATSKDLSPRTKLHLIASEVAIHSFLPNIFLQHRTDLHIAAVSQTLSS